MISKSKFLFITLVLLLVSLGTLSASDNSTDSIMEDSVCLDDTGINEDIMLEENIEEISLEKTIEKNNEVKEKVNNNKSSSRITTITKDTYEMYFTQKSTDSFPVSTELIQDGDTINLKGNFNNVNFVVDKSITFTSIDNDANLYDCTVYVLGSNSSGSIISNLNIFNNGTLIKGIQVKKASNLTIMNNYIVTDGMRSYALVADYMNNSIIQNNHIERYGDDWRHIALVIGLSYYNTIANNTIVTGDANGIYLSIYGSQDAQFDGGPSDYNIITGNNVSARSAVTSWCYNIQVMGAHNTVTYNTVSGGFRGISSQDYEDNVIQYNDVNAVNEGIYACEGATVSYNNIHVSGNAKGITVGGNNVLVEKNNITSINGPGIDIKANNLRIYNNNITSTNNSGIYSKGQYNYINIENNRINSINDGILFKQQSRTKKINNILVSNNNIVSESDYAVNFEEAGAYDAEDVNVTVANSNVLKSNKGTGNVAYLKPSNSNTITNMDSNQVIYINSANYTEYFDENLISNSKIEQNATIYLSGNFNNITLTFTKKVHLIGQNAVFKQGSIILTGDAHASTITGLKITNTNKEGTVHAIELIDVNNCEITNVTINNYGEYESFGIFLYGANGNTITYNKITTSGDYVNNGILAYGSDSNNILNNEIYINQTNQKTPYADYIMFNERIGIIQEVLHNHGIILLYSSYNKIDKNKIKVTSSFEYTFPTEDCKNSVVGIDMYFDCQYNQVLNNNINITTYAPFAYGMGVLGGQWGSSITALNASNNEFINNTVDIHGGYYATGFIAGRNSVNSMIISNTFNVIVTQNNNLPGNFAHGIVLENSTYSSISSNTINANAIALYSIELFDSSNNDINDNIITASASYPYGIAGQRASNNNIIHNNITLRKIDYGETSSAGHSDSIPTGDEAIMLMLTSTNNNITLNTIDTTANNTIKLTKDTSNNNVEENSLKAKTTYADNSVKDEGTSNTVAHNFLHFVNVDVVPVTAEIGETINLTANVASTSSDLRNITVKFKIGITEIGNATVSNGKAVLKYTIPTLFNPTSYTIIASAGGTNFQNTTASALAIFTKQQEVTTTKVNKVLAKVGSQVTLSANITTEDGGKIGSGSVSFYVDDTLIATSNVRLGVASCNYTIDADAENILHNINVIYAGTKDYTASNGSNILGVQSISQISMNNYNLTLGENAGITATITSGGKAVASGEVTIRINNTDITTASIERGIIKYDQIIPTSLNKGSTTLKVIFDGNDTLCPVTKSVTVNINPLQPIFDYNDTVVKVGENTSLVVGITDGRGYTANGGNVSLKLNNVTLVDSNGNVISGAVKNGKISFTFTAPSELMGYQNLTFVYAGNSKFASGEETFNNALYVNTDEKSNVELTIEPIASVNLGDNVIIKGTLLNNQGNVLTNANIRVIVNGMKSTVKTNTSGIYSLTIVANTTGTNDLIVSYAGNSKYNPASVSTTFTVIQDTILTVNSISDVKMNDNLIITGKLTSEAGKALSNANVKVSVNGAKTTVKTNKSGAYSLSVIANTTGTNKVVVTYAGNAKFNPSSVSTTFTVNQDTSKKNTIITVDSTSNVELNDKIVITGKLTNEESKALSSANVKVSVNGVKYSVKTDKTGVYSLTVVANTTGTNEIVVTYTGNSKFNPSTAKTNFTIKQDTVLTVNKISNVKLNKNVTITGTLKSQAGNVLKSANIKISLNGVTTTVKANSNGVYTYTTTAKISGTNNVTVTYAGNSKFYKSTKSTTFTVS